MQQFTCCYTTIYGNGCYASAELWNIYISNFVYYISSARPHNYVWQIIVRRMLYISRLQFTKGNMFILVNATVLQQLLTAKVLVRQDAVSCGNGAEVIFSARQHICYSALYAIARPSVCPSVRPSVTRVDQSKTVEVRITQPLPQSSPMTLVSWCGTAPWNPNGKIGNGGAKYERGMKKRHFSRCRYSESESEMV